MLFKSSTYAPVKFWDVNVRVLALIINVGSNRLYPEIPDNLKGISENPKFVSQFSDSLPDTLVKIDS